MRVWSNLKKLLIVLIPARHGHNWISPYPPSAPRLLSLPHFSLLDTHLLPLLPFSCSPHPVMQPILSATPSDIVRIWPLPTSSSYCFWVQRHITFLPGLLNNLMSCLNTYSLFSFWSPEGSWLAKSFHSAQIKGGSHFTLRRSQEGPTVFAPCPTPCCRASSFEICLLAYFFFYSPDCLAFPGIQVQSWFKTFTFLLDTP
jgi:hypothetical protein